MSSLGIFNKETKSYQKIAGEAKAAVIDTAMSDTSTSPVQNKVIKKYVDDLEGKIAVNLLNPILETTTKNGITCTNNGDGTYTLNGTATDSVFFNINKNISINKGSKYKVFCFKDEEYIPNKIMSCVRRVDTINEYIYNNGTFVSDTEKCWVWIKIEKDVTVQNLVAKPMITTDLSATYDDFVPYTGDTGKLNGDVADLVKKIPTFERNSSIFVGNPNDVHVSWANGQIGTKNDHWDDATGRHITYKFPRTGAYTVCSFYLNVPAHAVLLCELYTEYGGGTVEIREPLFFYNQSDTAVSKRVSCVITGFETGDEVTVICNPIVIKNV